MYLQQQQAQPPPPQAGPLPQAPPQSGPAPAPTITPSSKYPATPPKCKCERSQKHPLPPAEEDEEDSAEYDPPPSPRPTGRCTIKQRESFSGLRPVDRKPFSSLPIKQYQGNLENPVYFSDSTDTSRGGFAGSWRRQIKTKQERAMFAIYKKEWDIRVFERERDAQARQRQLEINPWLAEEAKERERRMLEDLYKRADDLHEFAVNYHEHLDRTLEPESRLVRLNGQWKLEKKAAKKAREVVVEQARCEVVDLTQEEDGYHKIVDFTRKEDEE
ncbi:hypothetical protein EJ02DRAFT_227679 [Clathrospora elynae]|uniref:Uncharacterized protein n=1 Tax=Clathrospora elynae TaxID=706981 RepID=A0A6A5SK57_9PLEO|nr:hypothetical protein EJ02DRAFT_227679 [Clathrospora elynae]